MSVYEKRREDEIKGQINQLMVLETDKQAARHSNFEALQERPT